MRYSLRTLFVVVLAVCLALGCWVERARRQRRATEAIRHVRGNVYYDFQVVHGEVDPKATSPISPKLRNLLGDDFFHSVVMANLNEPRRTIDPETVERTLSRLRDLSRLETLSLRFPFTTDLALKHVAGLTRLKSIDIGSPSQVSDDGLLSAESRLAIVRLVPPELSGKSTLNNSCKYACL